MLHQFVSPLRGDHEPGESSDVRAMLKSALRRAFAFACLWWVLAEGRSDGWPLAALIVGIATMASLRLWPPAHGRLSPRGLLRFAGFFLYHSAQGGVQVAWQALRPRTDLAPGLIELPTGLPPGMPRVLLANTLNLLPGTLSVHLDDDCLHVHVLDRRRPADREIREAQARVAAIWRLAE